MGFLLLLDVFLGAAVARAPAAQEWGEKGRYMTCKIAEGFQTSEASSAVMGLLPGWANGELAEACSWPDGERSRMPWSTPLHFADNPGGCNFSYARGCHGPERGEGHVRGRRHQQLHRRAAGHVKPMYGFLLPRLSRGGVPDLEFDGVSGVLPRSDSFNGNGFTFESLLFLAHFLGDDHQPMHCGRTSDRGGNTIVVSWYNTTESNLHKVWDVNVFETAMNRFYKDDLSTMIQAIKLNLTNEWSKEGKQWVACYTRTTTCADKYAEESAELACPAYVGAEQGSNLEDEYFFKAPPVVQNRVAQGGVRLAAILNRIFSGKNNSGLHSS